MNEKWNEYVGKTKGFFEKIPKIQKTIILAAFLIVPVVIVAMSFFNKEEYSILFSDLNRDEAGVIIGKIQEMDIPYKYENDGTVQVASSREDEARAKLIAEGYPKSGFSYDVFRDNVNMSTTDFEKKSYQIFDLQNRLAATIRMFEGVKDAQVTISPAGDRKYVLEKDKVDAKASIVVIMKDGSSPTENQVKGIRRLVTKSIPQLNIEDVVILDGNGEEVTVTDNASAEGATQIKAKLEREIESNIEKKVNKVISPIYGEDNIRISAHAELDLDKKIKEMINYIPTASQRGVIAQEDLGTETEGGTIGARGIPGTETNADIPVYSRAESQGNEKYLRDEVSLKYLVNQIKEQVENDAGELETLTVSLVINSDYIPQVEIDQLKELVGVTAGIPTEDVKEKVVVYFSEFAKPVEVPEETETEIPVETILGIEKPLFFKLLIAVGSVVFLLLFLIIFLLIRRRKKKKLQAENLFDTSETELALAEQKKRLQEQLANREMLELKDEETVMVRNRIRDFAESNPEASAELIRGWLNGGVSDE